MAKSEQKDVQVGDLQWAYRELVPDSPNDKPPVVMLHGLVSQSYSWRDVMPALAEYGFRSIAPDWIGHGSSSKPDIRQFDYKPQTYLQAFGDYIEALDDELYVCDPLDFFCFDTYLDDETVTVSLPGSAPT